MDSEHARGARSMIEQHSENALRIAEQRAQRMLDSAEMEMATKWLAIAAAIRHVQNGRSLRPAE